MSGLDRLFESRLDRLLASGLARLADMDLIMGAVSAGIHSDPISSLRVSSTLTSSLCRVVLMCELDRLLCLAGMER